MEPLVVPVRKNRIITHKEIVGPKEFNKIKKQTNKKTKKK